MHANAPFRPTNPHRIAARNPKVPVVYDTQIAVRVDADTERSLCTIAKAHNKTRATVIRDALNAHRDAHLPNSPRPLTIPAQRERPPTPPDGLAARASARVDAATSERLNQTATHLGISRSDTVRLAILTFLDTTTAAHHDREAP